MNKQKHFLRRRNELEKIEDISLASYGMRSGETAGRKYDEKPPEFRTHYQRDWNRIMHTEAFRKLEFKTQVLTFGEGAEVSRNRLTHTLEVEQIGNAITKSLGLNEDLVRSIAFVHDLGHTPFGHAGEETLKDLTGNFNHNIHTLKIITELEKRYPEFNGLNLTLETLEGSEKHETEFDFIGNHTYFTDKKPTLECQVVSIADTIAYRCHDIDDALRNRIISEEILDEAKIDIWKEIKKSVSGLTGHMRIAKIIRCLIHFLVSDTLEQSSKNLEKNNINSVDDVRNSKVHLVEFSDDYKIEDSKLAKFLMDNYYSDYRIVRMTEKGKEIIIRLFEKYVHSYKNRINILPPAILESCRKADAKGENPIRIIASYIAGMTDRFAIEEYRKLFDVNEKVQLMY